MKYIFLVYYAVAMFFPVILFTVLLDNANERSPFWVFVLCIALYAAAGFLSSQGRLTVEGKPTNKLKWVGWSAFVGLVEAVLLTIAV